MIDVLSIIVGTDNNHSIFNLESLEKKMKEWIGHEDFHLVAFTNEYTTIKVIAGHTINEKHVSPKTSYSLYRFFPLGNKWEVSVDKSELDAEFMMHELLTN